MIDRHPATWHVGTSFNPYANSSDLTLENIKDAGFNCIEVVLSGTESELDRGGLRKRFDGTMATARELGLDVWTVHLPFGDVWDISTIDPKKREHILEVHQDWIAWAHSWGVSRVIIHPSFEPIDDAVRDKRLQTCKQSLDTLARDAHKLGIQICVECLPRTCLGNQSHEIKDLIAINDALGVCCDVNHLLHEKPEDFIAAIGSRITTVHMSDYDGVDEKHWLPGKGIIDWSAVLNALLQAGYTGPFMFEVSAANVHDLMDSWKTILQNDVEQA